MQQINEDTGTARSVRRTILEPPKSGSKAEGVAEEDERGVALQEDPELGVTFVQALFGVLYEVFNSVVSEKQKKFRGCKICGFFSLLCARNLW